jgi:hypothetical protein
MGEDGSQWARTGFNRHGWVAMGSSHTTRGYGQPTMRGFLRSSVIAYFAGADTFLLVVNTLSRGADSALLGVDAFLLCIDAFCLLQ